MLNGSEGWNKSSVITQNILGYYTELNDMIRVDDYTDRIISDRLKTIKNNEIPDSGITGLVSTDYPTNNWLYIKCSEFTDKDMLISELQANNVTVVYQLAEEKVYECTNIDLITYANETNYVVNCGAIVPKTTLKVMSNISNTVRELQRKVSTLESYIQHVMIDALNNALNE